MKYLKYLFLFLCSLTWPLSFIFANRSDWFPFMLPSILILCSLYLFSRSGKIKLLAILFFLAALLFNASALAKNSIFTYDPLAFDTQVKKVGLIPNRFLARVVQNKLYIYSDKFTSNLFMNLDPNNYFFSFHPRETPNNQYLQKFPYFAFPLLFVGIFVLISTRQKFPLLVFLLSIIYLSFFKNFDRYDFLLWPTLLLFILQGDSFLSKKYPQYLLGFYLIALPITLFDFIRILLLKN